jgi:hypothetical protein
MIWIFTCSTKSCENHSNPVYLLQVNNPVLCSLCHVKTDAVLADEQPPTE